MRAERRFNREVRQKIPDWIRSGLSTHEIAGLIGIKPSSLKVMCSRYRISLSNRNLLRSDQRTLRVVLSDAVYETLQERAEQLCMTRRELSERVLEIVVKDDLFDALELV